MMLPRDPERISYAILYDEAERPIAQDRLLLRPFHAWSVQAPQIRVTSFEGPEGRFARYSSDSWVWGVVLDPSGESCISDDAFDLLPGIAYDVPLDVADEPRPVQITGNHLLLARAGMSSGESDG